MRSYKFLIFIGVCGWNRNTLIVAVPDAKPPTNCKVIQKSACESCPKNTIITNSSTDSNVDPFPSALVTACKETGKRIQWSCVSQDAIEEESKDPDGNNSYEYFYTSCQRTKIEEEYQVLQFQIFCLVLSMISLRSVKREKLLSESLFDKLKRQQQQQQQQQGKGKQKQQEMIPLV